MTSGNIGFVDMKPMGIVLLNEVAIRLHLDEAVILRVPLCIATDLPKSNPFGG